MSVREAKSIYESLLESGDLFDFYPNLTGDWSVDQKVFISQYSSTQRLLEDIDEDSDDDFEAWIEDDY